MMPAGAPEAVLFDLDGTLTDNGPGILNCVRFALEQLGLPAVGDEGLRCFIGPPLRDSFAALGHDAATCERAVVAYRERFTDVGLFENAVYPGIAELLGDLTGQGVVLGIATSKPGVFATRILEHFGLDEHFEVVVGSELDGTRSHKREVIAAALDGLAVDGTVVMVGDRSHDVAGARECGLDCIGVAWGYAEPGELERAGAVAVVETPDELADRITLPARRPRW